MKTIHQADCDELKAQLQRIEDLRFKGRPAADHVAVDCTLLEDLIQDHEDLHRLLKDHPQLREEVPYA